MKTKTKLSPIFIVGMILVVISFTLFLIFKYVNVQDSQGYSFICFIIAAAYGGYSIANFFINKKVESYNGKHFVFVLTLFSISCFCLNLEYRVFSEFTTEASVVLILFHLALVVHLFRDVLPSFLLVLNYFLLGIGTVFVLFYALFMLPFFGIGFIGLILFGLTIHVFIPLILFITVLILFIKAKKSVADTISFASGSLLPFVVIAFFISWNARIADGIHDKSAELLSGQSSDLPDWVEISQQIPSNYFTERILKMGIMYQDDILSDWGWDIGSSFDENKKNDPLLSIASLLSPKLQISESDRIKILNTSFNTRHLSRRKLWSGDHLSTSEILTNIRVYPAFRIAYTEKIISIKNSSTWHWNQQEALYSFKLPEGSTATSMSLWINGVEEKSRLSSRKNADSAYATIVGKERRDPSILHWQEGNIVTVAAFPCTPAKARRFKLGYTTPMSYVDGNLFYEEVHISGPPIRNCRETALLRIIDKESYHPNGLSAFEMKAPNEYTYKGKGSKHFTFSISAPELSQEPFSFDGKTYTLSPVEYEQKKVDVDAVYLDINKEWTRKEFDRILKICGKRDLYAYDDQLIKIEKKTSSEVFKKLSSRNYSLFPFHFIPDARQSIVVTKSDYFSPNVDEIKESDFGEHLSRYLTEKEEKINVLNLGETLSPYLETLKQFACFSYVEGNTESLKEILSSGEIPTQKEKENAVCIPKAGMQIQQSSDSSIAGRGNEHLMRLFAYNYIIQKAGNAFFGDKDELVEELVPVAEKAFVCSPVSSLIVLESVADYDRFDIKENTNSLGNASANSSGAVPEPHEWVLIILALSAVLYFSFRRKLQWVLQKK
jgi:XrtN system VIT domain protein